MSSLFSLGEVISCVDGEILIYGWLEPDEAIKSIEDYFDEVIQPEDIKEIKSGLWKYVPCRNNSDGYPGLYYPCQKCARGAINATLVVLK
jgi:hypothetical protein|nr:MAG TPA: hypothetical protein [Caudoviricetes sp.]DAR82397.1 MAG TPA: hypothetical protein [Caudoviricetes sp.]